MLRRLKSDEGHTCRQEESHDMSWTSLDPGVHGHYLYIRSSPGPPHRLLLGFTVTYLGMWNTYQKPTRTKAGRNPLNVHRILQTCPLILVKFCHAPYCVEVDPASLRDLCKTIKPELAFQSTLHNLTWPFKGPCIVSYSSYRALSSMWSALYSLVI